MFTNMQTNIIRSLSSSSISNPTAQYSNICCKDLRAYFTRPRDGGWRLDRLFLLILLLAGLTLVMSWLPRIICTNIDQNTFKQFRWKEHDDCSSVCENPYQIPQGLEIRVIPRIVISVTTSPKRLATLKEPLESLINQQLSPDVIQINLPYVFKRTGEVYEHLEMLDILKHRLIKINRCEDTGPSTKLLPTIQSEKNGNTLIIVVDDDTIYPPELVKRIVQVSLLHPNRVIAGNCGDVYLTGVNSSNHRCNLFQGFAGVGFRRSFFGEGFFDYMETALKSDHCSRGDDYTLSNYFALHGIMGLNLTGNIYVNQLDTGRCACLLLNF